MAGKVIRDGDSLTLGDIVNVAHADLVKMIGDPANPMPGTAAAKGIIMQNARINDRDPVLIDLGNGRFARLSASVYLQREPLTDAEIAACKAIETDRTNKKNDRTAQEKAQRERDIQSAARLGSETAINAMKGLGAALQAPAPR